MLKNFLMTLKRYKVAGVLNVLGLTLAFVAFYIIAAQVWYSVTYNRPLRDSERVYMVSAQWGANWAGDQAYWSANCPQPVSKESVEAFPDAESSTHFRSYANPIRVWGKKNDNFHKYNIGSYDMAPDGLEVFGFDIIAGDATKIKEPNTIVVSESAAERMGIGVGDILFYEGGTWNNDLKPSISQTVIAIFKDFPKNTFLYNHHIFKNDNCKDGAGNNNWNYNHFVKFRDGADLEQFKKIWTDKYAAWYLQQVKEWMEEDPDEEYNEGDEILPIRLIGLNEMYYGGNLKSEQYEASTVGSTITLASIALLIVVIAFINFVNFFMALVPVRIRSVNICKVFGAEQKTLRYSFLYEAVGLVIVAFAMALGVIQALQGSFLTEYVTCSLALPDNLPVIGIILALMTILAVISAIYPAFYITKFNASLAVKGGFGNSLSGRRMRAVLAGFQFAVAMVLIIVAASFWMQYKFMVNFDIGLDRENIMTFTSYDIRKNGEAVVEKLMQYPGVEDVTAAGSPITEKSSMWGRIYDGKEYTLNAWYVRWNMPQFFGIEVVEGNGFTEQSHSRGEMLFTQNVHRSVGIPVGHEENRMKVCGIAEDIKLLPVNEDEGFIALAVRTRQYASYYIRLGSGADISGLSKYVKEIVQEFAPGSDDPEVAFFNEKVEHLYNSTKKATVTIGLFALLAVVIALMGVFGIVMFETQHRRSEIAIRKVYGAERGQLVGLLNNQYVGLVLVSFVVAAPVAWWIVQRWLEQFANRIPMPWWIFVVALIAVMAITVALVTLRSWKAASENPVEVVKQ